MQLEGMSALDNGTWTLRLKKKHSKLIHFVFESNTLTFNLNSQNPREWYRVQLGRSYIWYHRESNATSSANNWCRTSNSSWCKICIFSHPVNHIVFLLLIGGRKFWDRLWHERICAGPFDGASDHVLHSGQRVDVLATQHHGVEGQDGPGDVHDDWDEERLLEDEV